MKTNMLAFEKVEDLRFNDEKSTSSVLIVNRKQSKQLSPSATNFDSCVVVRRD